MTELVIAGTKHASIGTFSNKTLGNYEVLTKEMLLERVKELTDEDYGYTILKISKDES